MTDAATQDYLNSLNNCQRFDGAKVEQWVDCCMDPWEPSLPEGWEEVAGSRRSLPSNPKYHKWSDRVRARSIRPIK